MLQGATPPTPEQTASKSDRAYEILRHRLIMLDIPPGSAINEAALSSELDLGRTPIREALKRLENDHLVVSFPRRGTFSSTIDITDLAMITEMRELLEPLAVRKAIENNLGELRPRFELALEALTTKPTEGGPRAALELDLEVHRLIYEATEHRYLIDTLTLLDDLSTRIWGLVRDRIPDVDGHVHEHADLLRAVLDGDAERAAKLAAAHVQQFSASIRAVL